MQWLSACCRVSKVIFTFTFVACDLTCVSWSFIFDVFLFYFFETSNDKCKKTGQGVPSSWSPVYVGLQRWRRRGSKIENQSSSSLHTLTGSNALQSSNRRLRVARAGASVYVVVQRCCRIKPLQRAGKAPGALPLSVPVCASLLLYYCCPNPPPPPPCVSAP